MTACMTETFGNPSSDHNIGIRAKKNIRTARTELLTVLGDRNGDFGDIIWSSGGTESNALGLLCTTKDTPNSSKHLVSSVVEHSSVLGSMKMLSQQGYMHHSVPVSHDGIVDPKTFIEIASHQDTVLATLMLVNNELGTIMPVADIATEIKKKNPQIHIHCDAIQALGKIPFDVSSLNVDSIALSSHKLHGPQGVGALWLSKQTTIKPFWFGGKQQKGHRHGTENMPGIAAFGEAVKQAHAHRSEQSTRWSDYSEHLLHLTKKKYSTIYRNGNIHRMAPHILSLSIPNMPSQPLAQAMEERNVFISTGSACNQTNKQTHVLSAINIPSSDAVLRISFGRYTTKDDIEHCSSALVESIKAISLHG